MECLRHHRKLERLFALAVLLLTVSLGVATAQTPSPSQSPTPKPSPTTSPNAPAAGDQSVVLSPDPLPFGDHDIGTTTYPQGITAKNNGKIAVTISGVSLDNASEFSETHTCAGSLDPGAQCFISVRFSPLGVETRTATVTVSYTRAGESIQLSSKAVLSGKGFAPNLRVFPTALDFGDQPMGSASVVRTLLLTAGPDNPVKIPAASVAGDFTVTPVTCDLKPAAACSLSVTFTPKKEGTTTGSLTIADDKGATRVVSLTGVGIAGCTSTPAFGSREQLRSMLPVLVVVFTYLLALLLVRWNMVARPARGLVQAQISAVTQRVDSLMAGPNPPTAANVAPIKLLLVRAHDLIAHNKKQPATMLLDYLFWTRGHEMTAWNCIHEAEEQLVFFLPEENVRAALERAEVDLREDAAPAAVALADTIHAALTATPPLPLEDSTRIALEAVSKFIQSQAAALGTEVSDALKPGATLSADQYGQLAQKVTAFITPEAASLSNQITQALGSLSTATVEALRPLLEQAASLLQPQTSILVDKLKAACSAAPPLNVDQWKESLAGANDYLSPHAELAQQIRTALAAKPRVPLERWRALLNEARGYIYDRTDKDFGSMSSWQNKTVWLVGCSLLLIVALAATLQHAVFFLVGAAGGLLSRMGRALYRGDVPTDYGASWTSLFLSPVVGALTGWLGILLIILAVELNILGSVFKFDWCNPYNPIVLALALALGFSERLFDGILTQLEQKVGGAQTPTTPAASVKITTGPALTEGKVGEAYKQVVLAASGGTPPYKWSVISGKLPAGITMDANGRISGMPTTDAKGTAKFTVQVTDAAANNKSLEFTIVVN
jgi:hypothetical protein